jgi:hypothetical protein
MIRNITIDQLIATVRRVAKEQKLYRPETILHLDLAAAELERLSQKCAHCPDKAVVDITLGDPINYSLCQRCSDLEDPN